MNKFNHLKGTLHLVIAIVMIFVSPSNSSFSGAIENIDGMVRYRTASGEYATNTWVWLDMNGDSVKECYRFDEDGHIAVNYIGNDGRRTNERGQLIEDGFIVRKLVSGKIVKNDNDPYVNVRSSTVSIINNIGKRVCDSLPFSADGSDGGIILTTKLKNEVVIPIEKNVSTGSNIIYANGGSGAISTITKSGNVNSRNIVAGKSFENYIASKRNAKIDVEKVVIFGNEIWEDVIELRGNNSYIKINTKSFNHMYFEVAEENHVVDKENDELLSLEVYVDGELYETLDEFVESEPQVEEIEDLDGKVVELKLSITGKQKSRRVYIRNGRLKKIREKNE